MLLAVVILVVDIADPLHRALALLLWLRGLQALLLGWGLAVGTLPSVLRSYAIIAIPFAVLHFGHRFWRSQHPRRSRRRWHRLVVPTLLLLGGMSALGLYAYDHGLYDLGISAGPLGVFPAFTNLAIAALAFWFLRTSGDQQRQMRRTAMLLVGLGLALAALHQAVFSTAATIISLRPEGQLRNNLDDAWLLVERATFFVSFLFSVASVTLVARRAATHAPRYGQALVVMVAAIATGLASTTLYWWMFHGGPDFGPPHFVMDAFWALGAAALIGSAVLRFQFLGVDLRAKIALRQSAFAALFGAIFLVITESTEALLPVPDGVISVAAALVVALAFKPLQWLAGRIADRLLPGVGQEAQVARRRKEIYDAALESIYQDGRMTARERRVLQTLRERLGISAKEAGSWESAWRAGA
jgi:hypothetical protein